MRRNSPLSPYPEMPVVEPPVKRPADYPFIPGHRCQSFGMLVPQLGIRMVKAGRKETLRAIASREGSIRFVPISAGNKIATGIFQ